MSSRFPLNIVLWKPGSPRVREKGDFYEIHDDFEKARNLICQKLKLDGFDAGVMWADAGPTEAACELHYRAFDDHYRGRCVVAGLCSEKEADDYMAELKEQYKRKVFSAKELYALKPINALYPALDRLERYFREESIDIDWKTWERIEGYRRVELRLLVDEHFGSDESFVIGTVWFDGNPVAVITHSGEDDDMRYITDIVHFYDLVAYLRTFMVPEEEDKPAVLDVSRKLPALTELDGYHTIHDFYDYETQTKKEKVTA